MVGNPHQRHFFDQTINDADEDNVLKPFVSLELSFLTLRFLFEPVLRQYYDRGKSTILNNFSNCPECRPCLRWARKSSLLVGDWAGTGDKGGLIARKFAVEAKWSKTGLVAQWIRHLTTNQGIAGSSPAKIKHLFEFIFCRKLGNIFF